MPAKKKAKARKKTLNCVQVRFQGSNTGVWVYLTYEKFKRGDLAVVQTPRGTYEIVIVVGFDDSYWKKSPHSCKWIVQKLSLREYYRVTGLSIRSLIEEYRKDHAEDEN